MHLPYFEGHLGFHQRLLTTVASVIGVVALEQLVVRSQAAPWWWRRCGRGWHHRIACDGGWLGHPTAATAATSTGRFGGARGRDTFNLEADATMVQA